MSSAIRAVGIADLPHIVRLNNQAVPAVTHLSLAECDWFRTQAPYFRVVDDRGSVVAFLIGLLPGLDYQSANYQWFERRGGRFVYIDRIVVAGPNMGHGLGRRLYQDLSGFAAPLADRLTCEVNLRPANPGSIVFHQRMGFVEVGRQVTEGGTKEVALFEKGISSDPR